MKFKLIYKSQCSKEYWDFFIEKKTFRRNVSSVVKIWFGIICSVGTFEQRSEYRLTD